MQMYWDSWFVILEQLSRGARYDRRKKHIYKQGHFPDIDWNTFQIASRSE